MLEVLLGYNQGAENSYLTIGVYENGFGGSGSYYNGELKARTNYIKEIKLAKVSDLLHWDLVSSDHLLLNSLALKIVLQRQRGNFVLMTDDASRNCRVRIIVAQLCVPYIKMSDTKYRNIQQSLLATPVCYPIKHVAQWISSLNWENAHKGLITKQSACTGSITKNSFDCKYFRGSQVAIYLNG